MKTGNNACFECPYKNDFRHFQSMYRVSKSGMVSHFLRKLSSKYSCICIEISLSTKVNSQLKLPNY